MISYAPSQRTPLRRPDAELEPAAATGAHKEFTIEHLLVLLFENTSLRVQSCCYCKSSLQGFAGVLSFLLFYFSGAFGCLRFDTSRCNDRLCLE